MTSCKPVSVSRRTLHRGVSKEFFVTFYFAFLRSFIAIAQGLKEARGMSSCMIVNAHCLERKDHLEDLSVDEKLTLKSVNTYVYGVRV